MYKAHKKQALAHKAFLTDGYKRGVLLQGRQSGKTFFATQHGWIAPTLKQGRYFIVFKTYKQAHEVVWRQYVPLIPKELVFKTNEQDLIIEFQYLENTEFTLPGGEKVIINHDKNLPRSTLQLLGSDQADSHRGFKADGMIFDEYADQDPNNWEAVYKHFFTTTDGWAIFMGTPRGYNHFYDMIQYAKENTKEIHDELRAKGEKIDEYDWFYQEATWRDSPYVKPSMMAAERAEAEKKGTLSTYLQEVELEFRSIQGAVYPTFSRKVHVVAPKDIPEELTIYAGIDFGYHTTACIFLGVDKDQNYWIFDEVYGKQEVLNDILPRIKQKLGDKRLVMMVGDSANRDAIEVMAKDFPMVPARKGAGSIIDGIDLIRNKLKPRIQLVGEPKPSMFITSNCKNLIQEIESYRYKEEKKERNPDDVPQKLNDHGPDALRYIVLQLKHGIEFDTEIPKPKTQFNSYGLL